MNAEVRDWADRQYVDLKKRDKNGNIRDPIGTGIDDIKANELYEKDLNHKEQLKKLSYMRKKSGFLYKKGSRANRNSEQLYLPMITTPLTRPGTGALPVPSELRLDPIVSHKSQYDKLVKSQSRIMGVRNAERNSAETRSPLGHAVSRS